MSLEQGDRWYPADLRVNLIQHREKGYLIQTHEKQEICVDIKHIRIQILLCGEEMVFTTHLQSYINRDWERTLKMSGLEK